MRVRILDSSSSDAEVNRGLGSNCQSADSDYPRTAKPNPRWREALKIVRGTDRAAVLCTPSRYPSKECKYG